jgi:hypothetical protein
MKTVSKIFPVGMFAAFLSVILFSSAKPAPGGDVYSIYLNDKMLAQYFVYDKKEIPQIQLSSQSGSDKVQVEYSHCGVSGKERVITILNNENKMVKTWKFPDVNGKNSRMSLPMQEVNTALKGNQQALKLYYTSKEIPEGKMLAVINYTQGNLAKK